MRVGVRVTFRGEFMKVIFKQLLMNSFVISAMVVKGTVMAGSCGGVGGDSSG